MRRPEIVDKIREVMHANFPEAQTYLYGSEARGDARPDSDFDLLILLPDGLDEREVAVRRLEVSRVLFDIELSNMADISPIILQPHIWYERVTPFTENVVREGILL